MSKTRVYIPGFIADQNVTLAQSDMVHKLRTVLRLRNDDDIFVFDGQGREYQYKVSEIHQKCVLLNKIALTRESNKPNSLIALGFPMLREDKIDIILQKATELGVDEYLPFISERSLAGSVSPAKFERWQKIVVEACRQSGRLWIPRIAEPAPLSVVVESKYSQKLYAAPGGSWLDEVLIRSKGDFLIIVGPEGDFTEEETALLRGKDFIGVTLSTNLLRVETAALTCAAMLRFCLR